MFNENSIFVPVPLHVLKYLIHDNVGQGRKCAIFVLVRLVPGDGSGQYDVLRKPGISVR